MNTSNADNGDQRRLSLLKRFIKWEVSASIMLIVSAVLALVIANSPWLPHYQTIQAWPLFQGFETIPVHLPKTFLLFVNDFLMAIFFLFVGLGIKNEFVQGELSTFKTGTLPFIAATFGMAVPAIIFIGINYENPENWRGWAIPSATDIAFAIGAIALLGKRVSNALRVLLVAIAVIDDLGAILIIAVFYTDGLHLLPLGIAFAGLLLLVSLNRMGVHRLWPYLTVGLVIWFAVHDSGIHATIAGVLLAMTVPCRVSEGKESPLIRLETKLANFVNFVVLPIFGFLNAGVVLTGVGLSTLLGRLPLGIALGLFIGKQIGIFGSIAACVRMGFVRKPHNSSYAQLYGMSLLCGIGFTMSLFIGGLSFDTSWQDAGVKIGVLGGSLVSLVLGYALLRFTSPLPKQEVPSAMKKKPEPQVNS